MMLARISPETSSIDQRTFECECGHAESVLVQYH
jgi:hypothetical protein